MVGETLGYPLTALWSVLVAVAITSGAVSRFLRRWGLFSAGLILIGVFVPLEIPGADMANFVGYVLWGVWLIARSVMLFQGKMPSSWSEPALTASKALLTLSTR